MPQCCPARCESLLTHCCGPARCESLLPHLRALPHCSCPARCENLSRSRKNLAKHRRAAAGAASTSASTSTAPRRRQQHKYEMLDTISSEVTQLTNSVLDHHSLKDSCTATNSGHIVHYGKDGSQGKLKPFFADAQVDSTYCPIESYKLNIPLQSNNCNQRTTFSFHKSILPSNQKALHLNNLPIVNGESLQSYEISSQSIDSTLPCIDGSDDSKKGHDQLLNIHRKIFTVNEKKIPDSPHRIIGCSNSRDSDDNSLPAISCCPINSNQPAREHGSEDEDVSYTTRVQSGSAGTKPELPDQSHQTLFNTSPSCFSCAQDQEDEEHSDEDSDVEALEVVSMTPVDCSILCGQSHGLLRMPSNPPDALSPQMFEDDDSCIDCSPNVRKHEDKVTIHDLQLKTSSHSPLFDVQKTSHSPQFDMDRTCHSPLFHLKTASYSPFDLQSTSHSPQYDMKTSCSPPFDLKTTSYSPPKNYGFPSTENGKQFQNNINESTNRVCDSKFITHRKLRRRSSARQQEQTNLLSRNTASVEKQQFLACGEISDKCFWNETGVVCSDTIANACNSITSGPHDDKETDRDASYKRLSGDDLEFPDDISNKFEQSQLSPIYGDIQPCSPNELYLGSQEFLDQQLQDEPNKPSIDNEFDTDPYFIGFHKNRIERELKSTSSWSLPARSTREDTLLYLNCVGLKEKRILELPSHKFIESDQNISDYPQSAPRSPVLSKRYCLPLKTMKLTSYVSGIDETIPNSKTQRVTSCCKNVGPLSLNDGDVIDIDAEVSVERAFSCSDSPQSCIQQITSATPPSPSSTCHNSSIKNCSDESVTPSAVAADTSDTSSNLTGRLRSRLSSIINSPNKQSIVNSVFRKKKLSPLAMDQHNKNQRKTKAPNNEKKSPSVKSRLKRSESESKSECSPIKHSPIKSQKKKNNLNCVEIRSETCVTNIKNFPIDFNKVPAARFSPCKVGSLGSISQSSSTLTDKVKSSSTSPRSKDNSAFGRKMSELDETFTRTKRMRHPTLKMLENIADSDSSRNKQRKITDMLNTSNKPINSKKKTEQCKSQKLTVSMKLHDYLESDSEEDLPDINSGSDSYEAKDDLPDIFSGGESCEVNGSSSSLALSDTGSLSHQLSRECKLSFVNVKKVKTAHSLTNITTTVTTTSTTTKVNKRHVKKDSKIQQNVNKSSHKETLGCAKVLKSNNKKNTKAKLINKGKTKGGKLSKCAQSNTLSGWISSNNTNNKLSSESTNDASNSLENASNCRKSSNNPSRKSKSAVCSSNRKGKRPISSSPKPSAGPSSQSSSSTRKPTKKRKMEASTSCSPAKKPASDDEEDRDYLNYSIDSWGNSVTPRKRRGNDTVVVDDNSLLDSTHDDGNLIIKCY